MIKIEVLLVLVGAYISSTEVKVALIKENGLYSLPREFLTNSSNTLQEAAWLLKRYMNMTAIMQGISVGHVPLLQRKIVDNVDRTEEGYRCIAVPYIGLIPGFIELPVYMEWVELSRLPNLPIYKDHMQIIVNTIKEKHVSI